MYSHFLFLVAFVVIELCCLWNLLAPSGFIILQGFFGLYKESFCVSLCTIIASTGSDRLGFERDTLSSFAFYSDMLILQYLGLHCHWDEFEEYIVFSQNFCQKKKNNLMMLIVLSFSCLII